ncbi:NUDIX domain-containing protein [Butyrivibrio fibrisolvens]|uniref:NUDIX domain-containing protein n=1 Tax=Butyrivibrio fibrisolvens TaxID=831 RepID=UPI0003B3F44E|nr:NUDIX domain-containing protein [Butyrivibrio fibrisolvens]
MAEEIFDIVDENGQPTGETVTRSQAHAEGIRHRTSHIWVVRKNGDKTEVLLQKRAMNKDSFPGRYDTSSAGHIQAGDEPLESAVRELSEELGVQADPDDLHFAGIFPIQYEKEFHGKPFKDNEIAFVYVYDKEVGIDNLTIQKEELDSVEWFGLEEVYQACQPPRDEKFCVPMGGLEIVRKYIKSDERRSEGMASGMPIGMGTGLAVGAAIGIATGRIGIWMSVGMIFGMLLGMAMGNRKNSEEE